MQELLNKLNNPTMDCLYFSLLLSIAVWPGIGYQNGGGYVLSIMHDRQSGGVVRGDDRPPLRFRKSR
jgi:hypothetical protein